MFNFSNIFNKLLEDESEMPFHYLNI